jgi:hypothetical protein
VVYRRSILTFLRTSWWGQHKFHRCSCFHGGGHGGWPFIVNQNIVTSSYTTSFGGTRGLPEASASRSKDEFARVLLGTCIITGVLREFNLFVTCISTHIIPGTNDYFYSHSRKVLQHVSPNGHTHIPVLKYHFLNNLEIL